MNHYLRHSLILISFFCFENLISQIIYSGTIGQYPVELVFNSVDNNYVNGIYTYKKHDTPISFSGNKQFDQWHLEVKDGKGKVLEQLKLYTDSLLKPELKGLWINAITKKMLDMKLTQTFFLGNQNYLNQDTIELLQAESSPNHYFKLLITKASDDGVGNVNGLKVYEKKTDVLLQRIELNNELRGVYSISVDDFNFDGMSDFSIFESSYAGPNTSRNYYLFNPITKNYFLSDISGVSLEFDAKNKIITEHNQCCAGSRILISQYKIKNNKMILFKETCLRWNEKLQKHVIGSKKDCQ
jgi:hypothetical protein